MLENTQSATYEVGADLKDATVLETWPLALDGRVGHALCIGTVRAPAISTVQTFADSSRVIPVDDALCSGGRLTESADLVCLGEDALGRLDELAAPVARMLAPGGIVVVPAARTDVLVDAGLHVRRRLWCAPSPARPVAIVPADDVDTIAYFASRQLHDPSTIVPSAQVRGEPARSDDAIAFVGASPAPMGSAPPAWLTAIAADEGVDISTMRWGIWARRRFSSQKVVIFLFDHAAVEPSIVVKLPRDERFNHRIENDYRAIGHVHALTGQHRHVPRPQFRGSHAGRCVAAVTAVQGTPFPHVIGRDRHGDVAWSVVRWLGELGALTARSVPSAHVGATLHELIDRVSGLFPLTADETVALRRHVDVLAGVAEELPVVMQHGNVADWNLIVRPDGDIVFLDWEFAEPAGPPLWDLFFFLRFQAWPLRTGWRQRLYGRWRPRRDLFLRPAEADVMRRAIAAYRRYVDVPADAIEPLFHLCWAHQCLNAATHETPASLAGNPMFRLLRRSLSMGARGELRPFLGVE